MCSVVIMRDTIINTYNFQLKIKLSYKQWYSGLVAERCRGISVNGAHCDQACKTHIYIIMVLTLKEYIVQFSKLL